MKIRAVIILSVIFVSLWGGASYLAYQFYRLKQLSNDSSASIAKLELSSTLIYNHTVILCGLILFAALAFIFTIMIVLARNSVRLAGRIMTEAAK